MPGAAEGITVAGGGPPGGGSEELYHPLGLTVRGEGQDAFLFIGDLLNYRLSCIFCIPCILCFLMIWESGWLELIMGCPDLYLGFLELYFG